MSPEFGLLENVIVTILFSKNTKFGIENPQLGAVTKILGQNGNLKHQCANGNGNWKSLSAQM